MKYLWYAFGLSFTVGTVGWVGSISNLPGYFWLVLEAIGIVTILPLALIIKRRTSNGQV